jgi:RNA-binding protein Nova
MVPDFTSSLVHSSKRFFVLYLSSQVPDALIGQLLGHGGSGIKEIQLQSGARIEVSSNGEYVPGTANRRITIAGTKQMYDSASFLIRQRLSRAQQNR